jgi:hypothetical protein
MNIEHADEQGRQWATESATLAVLLKILPRPTIQQALFKSDFNREELLSFVKTFLHEEYSEAYRFIETYFPQVIYDKQTCATDDLRTFFDAARAAFASAAQHVVNESEDK